MARLDNQAEQQPQLEEILQRLDGHGELLREADRELEGELRRGWFKICNVYIYIHI